MTSLRAFAPAMIGNSGVMLWMGRPGGYIRFHTISFSAASIVDKGSVVCFSTQPCQNVWFIVAVLS